MKIGIVGLGLIGGTYAKCLKHYGYHITGIDHNQETIDYALNNTIIDTGSTTAEGYLGDLDIIFICLYPNDTIKFIKKYHTSFKKGAIISDVSGIKRNVVFNLDFYNDPETFELVFAHPIAGSEKSGIKHSDKAIFDGANFVITPLETNTEDALGLIETLAKQMGFKNVSYLSPKNHDEIISYTSQLTHIIAIALMNADKKGFSTNKFIGDSFQDLTRIANINDTLWNELFFNNKDFLLRSLKQFEDELGKLKSALEKKDYDTLKQLMQSATEKRRKLQ
ncbi:MAG: prephenate dehydrogenase [Candidatus Izimaplasma sp.]|nr:prephenate dehydrogenase [Candidatus Izimaplasma bacterium]